MASARRWKRRGASTPSPSTASQRRSARARARTRLEVESLEDRIAPTIAFKPAFGGETALQGDFPRLNSPDVYLIFQDADGVDWKTNPT
jgi:hypothetical protein